MMGIIVMFLMASCGLELKDHVQYRASEIGTDRVVIAYVDIEHDAFYEGDTVIINNDGDIVNVANNSFLRSVKLIKRLSTTVER